MAQRAAPQVPYFLPPTARALCLQAVSLFWHHGRVWPGNLITKQQRHGLLPLCTLGRRLK